MYQGGYASNRQKGKHGDETEDQCNTPLYPDADNRRRQKQDEEYSS